MSQASGGSNFGFLSAASGQGIRQNTPPPCGEPSFEPEASFAAAQRSSCLRRARSLWQDAEGAFAGAKPKGLLRVDVHGKLARHFVLPGLPAFLQEYPDIQMYMSEGDRLVDLIREGIDCVLRVGDLQDSDMIARRVALLEEVTCVSPEYIARFGLPQSIDDLSGHQMIGFWSTAIGGLLPLEFTVAGGIRTVSMPAVVSVNGADTQAARRGSGSASCRHHFMRWKMI